jgi:hypothetical protein
MVCLVALGAALIWHDRRMVDVVNANHRIVSAAEDVVAGFATSEPDDAVLAGVMADMEGVVAAEGGAECSPLFHVLGREEIQHIARRNVATALAILARSEVLKGDLDAAAKAAERYREATRDDLVPAEVEAWMWRIEELVAHPGSRELDRARLRRALFAQVPIDEALEDPTSSD